MVGAGDGWAAGVGGVIIRWNGTTWNTVTSPTTSYLTTVFMVSASDGWAVGGGGAIIRWNGVSWTSVTSPTINNLYSMSMTSTSDGWAVGNDGTIIRWDESQWVPEFPSVLIVPLLVTVTLLAVVVHKRKSRTQYGAILYLTPMRFLL